MRQLSKIPPLIVSCILIFAIASDGTTYTVADFTNLDKSYATSSNSFADASTPFTLAPAESAEDAVRVYSVGSLARLPGNNNWILATFSSPLSDIIVFPNIDLSGAAYEEGSDNGTRPLLDVLTAAGSGEPFTIGTYTGIAPFSVHNMLTGGFGLGDAAGYLTEFNLGTAYQSYAYSASTEVLQGGSSNQELSAVGSIRTTEESASLLLLGSGLVWFAARRRKTSRVA